VDCVDQYCGIDLMQDVKDRTFSEYDGISRTLRLRKGSTYILK
jgi:hypothetical protein